ncbi:MAG: ATP synthase F1 subunit gamma [Candidatus Sungbacteria bacterium RIFCSPLOWO2_02_FULL_51_17]|uniref:ATP synthase gamma chain n=1 Tax=Candidatus Sungbacteria bacterium RIFCSPHIGHO2_02_FULL_51_29 TaxID=1802273 RepID=A0A1G2KR62_9BACT|nr:MAG: ATP synthase F1 subunit gamma [Candidatus Sungbacteria bacterium RIFCSPHIGHO2_02_FULL_51_29]OHA11736.1 MAG: ATP synthase F1 subunit gamma [Candidatus Sungbacteria bacterium RIFCSPLOWO2_02_FULL_51_17]
MPSTKAIKQRIKSVKNTRQITKAMEVVSATKMRKSQGFALDGRPYALAALEMLGNITARTDYRPVLLQERPVNRALVVVVTSDKGLAGAFNANVLRRAEKIVGERESEYPVDVVTVGKKAREYFGSRSENVVKEFLGFGDFVDPRETNPLSDFMLAGFAHGRWDAADMVYTNFRSTLKQEVRVARVFPVDLERVRETIRNIIPEHGRFAALGGASPDLGSSHGVDARERYTYEYTCEPSSQAILDALIPHLLGMQIFHMILESNASEHSARMVAMKNASENAADIITELTLQYNKQRQAAITKELTEITAGKEALEG